MSNPTIVGHMAAVESPDTFAPIADHQALYGAGLSLMAGVRCLCLAQEPPPLALTFLSGQTAECLLKALLCSAGVSEKELRAPNIRHDLVQLWVSASQRVPSFSSATPEWLEQLSRVHAAPYVLRYPLGLHGLVLPVQSEMVRGLEDLLAYVSRASGAP